MGTKTTPFDVDSGQRDGANGQHTGEGNGNGFPESQPSFPVNGAVLGIMLFIATELMFFAGLISSFIILRAGATDWPPVGQPTLPVFVTGMNTLFLLMSALTMYRAFKAIRFGDSGALVKWLGVTAVLGMLFLCIQGYEWIHLLGFGLTLSSSIYGGTFYTLIGAHGLHVFIAVIALIFVLRKAFKRQYSHKNHTGVRVCQIYWFFVVGIWPLLYVLVYLN